jgi:hypothetical protein
VHGAVVASSQTVEAFRGHHHRSDQRLVLAGESLIRSDIDVSWLPAASETYQISDDPRDYVLADIPIVTVDIPNRNMQAFPYEEVSYFDPSQGRLVYQTFLGRPTHIDHDNKDPLKAKGVIFDSALQFVPAYNVWKIRILAGWDRSKDPQLVRQILEKKRTGYSMGALVNNFVCSVCGNIDTNMRPCKCMARGKGMLLGNKLVYQMCVGAAFIETSSVDDPADVTADSDMLFD